MNSSPSTRIGFTRSQYALSGKDAEADSSPELERGLQRTWRCPPQASVSPGRSTPYHEVLGRPVGDFGFLVGHRFGVVGYGPKRRSAGLIILAVDTRASFLGGSSLIGPRPFQVSCLCASGTCFRGGNESHGRSFAPGWEAGGIPTGVSWRAHHSQLSSGRGSILGVRGCLGRGAGDG